MKILEAIRIAMRALAANKLRSILTMLGIIIGVGAVIALMSIGRGVEKYVTDQFAGLGSNLLFIAPGSLNDGPPNLRRTQPKPLTMGELSAITDSGEVPEVRAAAGAYSTFATVGRNGKDLSVSVNAVTPNFPDVRAWNPSTGQFFTQTDFDERQRVVLLGQDVYTELFPGEAHPAD